MLLFIHIVCVLFGLLAAAVALVSPTATRLHIAGIAAAATLASGVALVFLAHVPLMSACVSGIAYLGTVGVLILGGSYRLAHQRTK